ncbi:MAG: GAF domain-containing protein [Lachnospiraceae bacterium]|nr:GAF domain-containing protein [Lachnospiraceae bacterium]
MKAYDADRLIQIAIALTAEKDFDALLDRIIAEAMDITECDGGTVYTLEDDDMLYYHNVITRSKGFQMSKSRGEIPFPPIPLGRTHVCACAALDNQKINIPDIYESVEYDFTGAQRFDAQNDYRSGSMLVIPMEDERGRVIGVLQLLNALDEEGEIIPFDESCERIISALASLAAVSLNNRRLSKEILDILHSFVRVMVSAIDTRSPYNANHTKSMVRYGAAFLDYLNETEDPNRIPEEERDAFLMSVWLHDLGKLVIPLEVMDKPTRLGSAEREVFDRIEIAVLRERIYGLEHPSEAAESAQRVQKLTGARELIREINGAGFLQDDKLAKVMELEHLTMIGESGEWEPLLTPENMTALSIRKGTLTDEERHKIEEHVEYTEKMLTEMDFDGDYKMVPVWASGHHEFLNGTGYPHHLSAPQLPKETRILTILDIYDALTAEDRPYKPPMPAEKAFGILESMASEGKLDGELLQLFKRSGAWKKES